MSWFVVKLIQMDDELTPQLYVRKNNKEKLLESKHATTDHNLNVNQNLNEDRKNKMNISTRERSFTPFVFT